MQIPLNLTARRVELPPAIEELIRRRVDKLERHSDRIIRCDVVVEGPGERHESGGPYEVRLDISVPGSEIVVNQHPAETLRAAVDAAFRAAERQVEEYSRKQRGEVKTAVHPPEGPVVGLFPEEGYGFIAADDGREIYFHRNAVLPPGFDGLSVGSRVRFHEEQGNEGPQASTVEAVGAARPAPGAEDEEEVAQPAGGA
jgi:ribosomal subunit interface protein